MSNISRRDFLKTAGVMTLAVAAAGVLAGCEGNAAPVEPETPVDTAIAVGKDTVSFKGAKLICEAEYKQDSKDASKMNRTETARALAVLTCTNHNVTPASNDECEIKYYINDKQVFHEEAYTFHNSDLKDAFGIKQSIKANQTVQTNDGELWVAMFPIDKDFEGNFKAVTSAKVVVLNKTQNTVTTVNLDVPADVTEVCKY